MTPEIAAYRLGCAAVLGAALGLFYGFLRPLRPRHTLLADGVFLLAAIWAWVYHSFAVCAGDIRAGYLVAFFAGGWLWEAAFGRWLRPVFWRFWDTLGTLGRLALVPLKKILVFTKILFASVKKWVTIVKTHVQQRRKRRRGTTH